MKGKAQGAIFGMAGNRTQENSVGRREYIYRRSYGFAAEINKTSI